MAGDTVTTPLATRPEERASRWLSRESTRRFVLLGLEAIFLLAIVVSAETLFSRENLRFDLTPTKKYSLAPITVKIVRDLTRPVQATVFYRRGDRGKHEELLSLFTQENPLFRYELYDLDRAPGLAQRYGVTAYGTTVLETAGTSPLVLPLTDEERLLNALLRLFQTEQTVYFLVGHGENDATDTEERNGYGVVRQVLETENYRVRPLLLRETQAVPPDANLVVVSGPQGELSPTELQAFSAYFAAGGNALFMLDPYTVPGLARYLTEFGFALEEDVVVDEQNRVAGGEPLMPLISNFADEVFPRQLRGEPILPVVRPIHVQDGKARAFAFSSEESWALKDRRRAEQGDLSFRTGEDERGPLPVAAIAHVGKEKEGKLVVIGDSDFVNNFYARVPGNVDFFMNTVGWMLDRQELISVGRTANVPQSERVSTPQQSLYLTAEQSRTFFWVMVVLQPALVLVIGLAVFIRRRK